MLLVFHFKGNYYQRQASMYFKKELLKEIA